MRNLLMLKLKANTELVEALVNDPVYLSSGCFSPSQFVASREMQKK